MMAAGDREPEYLHRLDLSSGSWGMSAALAMSPARAATTRWCVRDALFVFGGMDGDERFCDLHVRRRSGAWCRLDVGRWRGVEAGWSQSAASTRGCG